MTLITSVVIRQAETEHFFLDLIKEVQDGIKDGFAQQFKTMKRVFSFVSKLIPRGWSSPNFPLVSGAQQSYSGACFIASNSQK